MAKQRYFHWKHWAPVWLHKKGVRGFLRFFSTALLKGIPHLLSLLCRNFTSFNLSCFWDEHVMVTLWTDSGYSDHKQGCNPGAAAQTWPLLTQWYCLSSSIPSNTSCLGWLSWMSQFLIVISSSFLIVNNCFCFHCYQSNFLHLLWNWKGSWSL